MTPVEWLEARFDRKVGTPQGGGRPILEFVDDLSPMHRSHDRASWPHPYLLDDLDELDRRARGAQARIVAVAAEVSEVPEVGYLSRAFDTIVETP